MRVDRRRRRWRGEKFERYLNPGRPGGGVSISGAGRFVEGQILTVGGSARISRDLEVELLTVGGSLRADGRVRAETARIGGSASFRSLEAKRLSAGGSISIEETLKVDSGSLGGAVRVGEVRAGTLSVGGSIRARRIEAEVLRIDLGGGSEVDEIKAGILRVRRSRGGLLGSLLGLGAGSLRARRIEADSADVEWVECDEMVVGNARIGRGCRIGRLSYSGEVRIERGASVRETERRPAGEWAEGEASSAGEGEASEGDVGGS